MKVTASSAKEAVDAVHFVRVGLGLFMVGWLVVCFGGGLLHLVFGSLWLGWWTNTIFVAVVAVAFAWNQWRKATNVWTARRLQVLGDNGLPAPSKGELKEQWRDETKRTADVRQAWLTGCNVPAMQGKRSGEDKKSILPLQNVRTDANGAVWAEVAVAGGNGVTVAKILDNQDVFRDLTPDCVDFEVRKMNGTGHRLQLIWHYKARFEGVVRMADVPLGPKGTLAFGVRPDGKAACIPASQGVSLYGLTRRGKSYTVRALMLAAQRAGIPTEYYVADLKANGFQMAEFDRPDKGEWKGSYRVAAYTTTVEGTREMLTTMVTAMRDRGARLRGTSKQHVPTHQDPLMVFVADETLPLWEIMKEGFRGNLGEIGFSGSALGVCAWMNVQLTDKAATGDMRDLTPGTLCFGVKTQAQMEAALGNGAAAGGAKCHLNPPPGVGWMTSDSDYGWDEFRSAIVTDEEIAAFAEDGSLPPGVGQQIEDTERWCAAYVLPNAEGRILYVGKAFDPWGEEAPKGKPYGPGGRFAQHEQDKPWWHEVDWSQVTVYWRRTEDLAFLLESILIKQFRPRYNDQQNRNNPLRVDWKRDGYVPLEDTLPPAVVAEEKAQQTRRGRMMAVLRERRAAKKATPVEPEGNYTEIVGLGELMDDAEPAGLGTSLRAARSRSKVAA